MLNGKTILITGGTGSFGSHILKRVLSQNLKEIRIFSRDEKKQDDLKHLYPYQKNLRFIIGDVRDLMSIINATKNVDYIFHAAALKQVPSSEYNVFEVIQTNIIGAKNVIEAAKQNNVEKVIAISTDKAVEPVNVMGMTKALQEKLFIAANMNKNGHKTIFSCVRYGNVLGSRGSVIPVFKKQIEKGQHITITDPSMTRFVLNLDEAIDLVFHALEHAIGGEIFVLKLPAHSIGELAEVMVEELKAEKGINIVGIRPGEKIHETLISPTESIRTIEQKNHFIILPTVHIDEIEQKYGTISNTPFRYSSDTTKHLTKEELRELFKKINHFSD